MKSKTSFINKTMLQKNVKLYWPIWTLYTIVLLLNGPFSMWSRFKNAEFIYGTNWHKYMLDIMSPAISMEADMIFILLWHWLQAWQCSVTCIIRELVI